MVEAAESVFQPVVVSQCHPVGRSEMLQRLLATVGAGPSADLAPMYKCTIQGLKTRLAFFESPEKRHKVPPETPFVQMLPDVALCLLRGNFERTDGANLKLLALERFLFRKKRFLRILRVLNRNVWNTYRTTIVSTATVLLFCFPHNEEVNQISEQPSSNKNISCSHSSIARVSSCTGRIFPAG